MRRRARNPAYRAELERLAPYEALARIVIRRRGQLNLSQAEPPSAWQRATRRSPGIESEQRPTTVQTLRRLAAALDTHLVVGFADEIPGVQTPPRAPPTSSPSTEKTPPRPRPAPPPPGEYRPKWAALESSAPGNVHVRKGATRRVRAARRRDRGQPRVRHVAPARVNRQASSLNTTACRHNHHLRSASACSARPV